MGIFRDNMRYIEFNSQNPRCIHCFISDRAYATVISEVMSNGQNETGGVFLGYIVNRAWYIVEAVDAGLNTVNQVAFFQWDTNYVNYQSKRLSKIYKKPLTILGFWHRHPGSMDYFSGQDESTIRSNLRDLKLGLLSMLVNIDPKLRMTYYYCYGNDIMRIRYDVGDKYFPAELLAFADANELSGRAAQNGRDLQIYYEQVINLEAIAARKKAQYRTEEPDRPRSAEATETTVSENHMSGEAHPGCNYDELIGRIRRIVGDAGCDTGQRIDDLTTRVEVLETSIDTLLTQTERILSRLMSDVPVTEGQEESAAEEIDPEKTNSEGFDQAEQDEEDMPGAEQKDDGEEA